MGLFKKFSMNKDTSKSTKLVPGIGRLPYSAYRGKDKYIFVSYAHIDHEIVFEEIKRFNEAGFNVWYDEGIAPGSEWTKQIASALQNCSLFVVMITPDSAIRRNVQNEINFAVNRNIPFIAIHLKKTILPPDMELQIGVLQAILKYCMSDEEYDYKYIDAFERLGMKRSKKPNAPGSAPSVQQPVHPAPAAAQPAANIYNDSPEDAKKRANGDLVRVDGYDIEHGSLKGYFGTDKELIIPNSAVVIPSTAFRNCRLFVESIDLNRAGCVLGYAFENCPNLHTIKVPPTVTTFKPNAIINCPNVTLYIRRDQLPEGYENSFSGKKIVYLDEPKPVQSAASIPDPAPDPPVNTTAPAQKTIDEITLPTKEHKWGNYVPKGTAIITAKDGTVYTAIANSLVFCSKNVNGITTAASFFQGLQTKVGSDGKPRGEMIYFSDMESVNMNGDKLIIKDFDEEETEIELDSGAELWFIGEKDGISPTIIRAAEIQSITFDRTKTPATSIRYGCITTIDGSFLSPLCFIWLKHNVGRGAPRLEYTKDFSCLSREPLPFKRIKRITVTKNSTQAHKYAPITDMEMKALLKNGEEIDLVMNGHWDGFCAMTASGVMRGLPRSSLKEINMVMNNN